MKKFFACLLFVISTILPQNSNASVQSAAQAAAKPISAPKIDAKDLQNLYKEIPDLNDTAAIEQYLKKRLSIISKANILQEDINTPASTSIVSTEELQEKQKATISAYEQIYQDSMNRANRHGTLNEDVEIDGTFYRLKEAQEEYRPFVPDFPYVTVRLSDKREILAPAEEHIAYMLTSLNIEPTGLLRVTEEFVFVSNNEGFPTGFYRILPKYAYSLNNTKRRIDLSLESVTVNDQEVPYKITEIGNYLHIEPKEPLDLPTGIYTYRFNYLIDRAVWFYNDFDELYWDITGRTIKNVIGSTNAVAILPTGKTFMEQNAFVSTKEGVNPQRVTITTLTENSLGFADTDALDVGEDIHLFIRLEKGIIVPPDFAKKYTWYIHDYGAVLFALLALAAIFTSYKISAAQIRRNQDKTRITLQKTPALFRLINAAVFDKISFGAEILNLCSKNILELRAKENSAVLIKKTDNLSKLSKTEQQFIQKLFPNLETALPATPESRLKLERAYKYLKGKTTQRFRLYKLQLNSLYLLFSLSMLFCGIVGASAVAVNPLHTFLIITSCTVLIFAGLITLSYQFHRKLTNWIVKALVVLELLSIAGWMAIYTSNVYAVIIILTAGLILSYYRLFSRRNGLLRNKIKETEDYKSYLQKNIELTQESRDFNAKIPYIFAFGLESKYQGVDSFALINCLLQQLNPNQEKD
ncbi:MAG: DUF2207 domain-containing protein [Acetobacter sp.]|nr:DUF2207 domain-containing protein [Acetobacter sp.]